MPRSESMLAEGGVETLKHLGATGLAESLSKIAERIPDMIAQSGGVLPAAGPLLAGLVGGPLVWGVVLIGGCLWHCRKNGCKSKESQKQFRHLARTLHGIEAAARENADMRALLNDLLEQNATLRDRLERGESDEQALTGAAEEIGGALGLEIKQFQADVRIYLVNLSEWIEGIGKVVDKVSATQDTALAEQRAGLDAVLSAIGKLQKPGAGSPIDREALERELRAKLEAEIEARLRAEMAGMGGDPGAAAEDLADRAIRQVKSPAFAARSRGVGGAEVVLDDLEQEALSHAHAAEMEIEAVVTSSIRAAEWAIVIGESARAAQSLDNALRLAPGDAWLLILRGRIARTLGSLPDADRFAHRALAAAPDQRTRSVAHNEIGNVLTAQGDLPAALTAYRAGLAIAESLAQRDGGNTQWQRDLSVSHDRIGDVLTAQGDLPGGPHRLPRGAGHRRDARQAGRGEYRVAARPLRQPRKDRDGSAER